MLRGMAILLGLQLVGELITYVLKLPLPGSVVGMLLLLAGLRGGILRVDWVKEAAELLLRNLSLLFVPAGVGVIVYAGLIAQHWLPLTVAATVSTLAVLATTGWSAQWLARKHSCKRGK
ncbi:MAG: CidA/LrgA family protein [Desulfuromonas sp.]|nr:CidA/LrgA family protein [Desulfuromonas sp.]